ncbi:unnamed protein product [Ostreobium quekettii]|uniref:Uncharacterized protein n=1 Tax=Ostreobium quekettii TaxID=121088 RepID=A0A8S1IRE4_9CHLO|nr:unnamed protein product [Ostreobium quekettii]|eukprot:evm.model.scf_9.20 EVM.evm.TU.scf_9.20   scf_9:259995-260633(-)
MAAGDSQHAVRKALALVKNKFDIFCGEDKCRFRPAAGPKAQPASPTGPSARAPGPAGDGSSPDTYEALGSDKALRNLGQIATLGVGGALRRPVKSFQILGVDQSTLAALAASVGHAGATFEEIMAFLGSRHYVAWMTDDDRRLGWTRVTVVMKREDGEGEEEGGSNGRNLNLGGLGKGKAFIRPQKLREVVSEPVGGGPDARVFSNRANTIS